MSLSGQRDYREDRSPNAKGKRPRTETSRLNDFETTYSTGNLTSGADIASPRPGDLSYGGERVALEKPQASDEACDPGNISWIIVDEVIYFDQFPWPTAPDGLGGALQRVLTAREMTLQTGL